MGVGAEDETRTEKSLIDQVVLAVPVGDKDVNSLRKRATVSEGKGKH